MTTSNPIQIILNESKKDRRMVGIDIIKSPMKYEILDLLKDDEMNFEEIVENTSKSKASVSMHLRDLRKEGIVNYKADPSDNRKKIFYLNADYLGSIDSNNIKKTHENQTKHLIDEFIDNGDIEYVVLLTHTFKSLLMEFGMTFHLSFRKWETTLENTCSAKYMMKIWIFLWTTFHPTGKRTI